MLNKNKIEQEILSFIDNTRFAPDLEKGLEKYIKLLNGDEFNIQDILVSMVELLDNPKLNETSLRFPNYKLPEVILSNNGKVRIFALKQLRTLYKENKDKPVTLTQFASFLVTNHEYFMWAKNAWLLANPGVTLEPTTIKSDLPRKVLDWLEDKFLVKVGDQVLELHVISENGRKRLEALDFSIPFKHWDYSYFIDGMYLASLILGTNNGKGVYSKSWMYNPDNFVNASDSKPYASFTFLKEELMIGSRLDVTHAISQELYKEQQMFAFRNDRRRRLAESGEFNIKVFVMFYAKKDLNENMKWFTKELRQ